ncbi:MAG TPA: Hsp70 family protein [Candidatus Limnocylindria bacterium]|jgi:actin-like ATPase involved in cell morphogenesis|nr:Hsp70 family protein [Candidatus Limnocylindria bacterium]
MKYALGVDLGTTYTAAAVGDASGVAPFALGSSATAIPSIVFVREDGEVLVGEAAERRATVEPARAAREFKRRLGDQTPIVVGGTPFGAEALMARLLSFVISRVSEERGERPSLVVFTHPATYGPYKLDLVREVARLAEVESLTLLSEPQAAAIHYSTTTRVASGELIAVFDFGGGTLDAAVVRKTDDGFELLGEPQGIERFGGIDIDEAVLSHVIDSLGTAFTSTSPSDQAARLALSRLREDSRRAKESLSTDTETVIPVFLPALHTEVRLTRAEFEAMLRPRVSEMTRTLKRATDAAGVGFAEVSRVLLVGGSSRIPLVAEAIRSASGRPIAVDANPKQAISLGAAALGAALLPRQVQTEVVAEPQSTELVSVDPKGPTKPRPEMVTALVPWLRGALGSVRVPTRRLSQAIAALVLLSFGTVWVFAAVGPALTGARSSPSHGGSGSPSPPAGTQSPTASPGQFGDFRLALKPGSFWEFGWDHVASASGVRPTERKGEFRVSLGAPTTIAGKTLYAVSVQKLSGSDLSIVPTRWAYLGVDGNRLVGSLDGVTIRVALDAERGAQPGGGFFGELVAADRLLSLGSESIKNAYVSGPAVTLRQASQSAQCQNFSGLGLVCPGNRESATRVDYFREGIGPIGYYFFGSVSTSGGGASTTINIGLLRYDLAGAVRAAASSPSRTPVAFLPARGTAAPTARALGTPAAGLVRVTDDTRTISIDVPREWTVRDTAPITEGKFPRVLATTDFDDYQTLAAPGVAVSVWSDPPAGIPLTGVLDALTGSAPNGCEVSTAPHLNSDGSASAMFDCPDADAGIYYLTWIPTGRSDRLVIFILQITADTVTRYSSFYAVADASVTLYR